MKQYLNFRYSFEILMGILVLGSIAGVLITFSLGHYITPTIILADGIIFFNLCYFGLKDKLWAKHILFWIGLVISFHLFFSLFFAITPPKVLGELFMPLYLTSFIIFSILTWKYATSNRLFSKSIS